MNTSFTIKLLAPIAFSLITTILSAINFKTDLKKEISNSSTLPYWQHPHIPDYAAELQKYNPSKKEPDKQQAKEFIANAKQNVSFLENKGQMMDTEGKPVPFVLFKAEAPGMNVYITEKGLTYVFVKVEEDEEQEERKPGKHQDLMMPGKHEEKLKAEMAWINVNLKGATIKRENIIKEEQSAEHFNYFYGHCPDGIYDVYQYKKLTIKNVYPNIDWVFYNSQKGGMKYDFIVNPGANPNDIKLIYESETPLNLDEDGNLQLKTKLGSLTENAPYSYIQQSNTEVKSSFKTTKLNKHEVEVTFTLDQNSYTQNSTLVIDPQLVWGTFYGGSGQDYTYSIESDSNGNVFVTGFTASTNFPLQNAGTFFQGIFGGAGAGFASDAFILKFTNNGNLLWATYYGGSSDDVGFSIYTDSNGNVFVTGSTNSTNFPVQNAGTFFQGSFSGGTWDAFILKFNNNGNRLWATFYGGSAGDTAYSICTDLNGNVFLTGYTNSNNFPVQNAGTFFQGTFGGSNYDVFILKFDNNGNRLWATYYGGSDDEAGFSICTDLFGNVFVTGFINSANFPLQNAGTFFQGAFAGGNDAFILKFDNNGNRLWATYYGGSGIELSFTICTDSNGNVFVSGYTTSANFPVQNAGTFFQGTFSGATDAFILKFDNAGNRLWATYFGSNSNDLIDFENLVIDNCDNVYLSLQTPSNSFPHLLNSTSCSYFDNSYNGGATDFIITRFTNNGSLNWCTYLGGNGSDGLMALDIDLNNNLFTSSDVSMPITSASYSFVNPGAGAYNDNTYNGGDDVYILKFSPAPLSYTSSSVPPSACGVCDGSASFSITTCGEAPFSYVWSNGTSVLNTTVTTSSISNLCSGVYNVTVTSGCAQTVQSYNINAGGGPTFTITNTSGSYSLTCTNPTINLSVATNYTAGTANFFWINNTSTFTSSLTTVSLTGSSSIGIYTVSLTDPATACSTSQTFAIGQNVAIPVNTVSPASQVITCNAGAVTFTSTISSPTVNVTSSWFYNSATFPGGPSLVTNGSVSIGAPTSPGTIIVQTCNNVNGCCNTKTLTVTASTNVPTFNVSSSTNFILGCSPVNVTTLCINPTSAGAVNFLFLPPTSTLSVPIPTLLFSGTPCTTTPLPGTWTLVALDPNSGCQTPLPVVILTNTVAPDVSAGILTQTLTCINPTVLAVGTSSTPNTDLGWLIPSAPFSLPTPTITLGPITAGATNTNLPNFYATYTAVATNTINQCKSSQTYSIYQNFFAPSNIGIGVSTPSNITCQNPCVSLSFTGATLSYPGGVSIPTNTWTAPPPTSNTSTLSTTSACVAGDYTLTVTDGKSSCAASKVYKVIEQLNTPVLANLPSYTLDCSATSSISAALIQISLTSTLSNWSIFVSSFPANAAFSNINLTTPPNGLTVTPVGAITSSFTVDKTGSYSFTAKNLITGCTEDGVFQVVAGGLTADFSPSTLTGFAPLGVTFSNLSSSSSAATGTSSITTVWSFGNGAVQTTTATSISTNATYNNPGTYTVTIVSTKGSCIDSAHKIIRVDIPSKLEIPNVFTPNGDGSNDVFFLKTSNLTEITALIFDRWGNKVYDLTSSTGNIAWDGKNLEGRECAAGTFFYIIKAKGKDGQSYEKKGNVSLFR